MKRSRTAAVAAVRGKADGRSVRWEAHREARRQELIEAAITAIREHGASVGMDQIAAAAKTSKPVIYRYFTDKADLYRAVVAHTATDLIQRVRDAPLSASGPREIMAACVDAFLSVLDQDPELYKFAVSHPMIGRDRSADELLADYTSAISEIITQRLADNLRAAGRDPASATPGGIAIVGFVRAAGDWWVEHHDAMTRAELTEYLTSILWGGAAGIYRLAGMEVDNRPPEHLFPRMT